MPFWSGGFRTTAGGVLFVASLISLPAFLTGATMGAADMPAGHGALGIAASYLLFFAIMAIPCCGAVGGWKLMAAGARTAGWLPLASESLEGP